GSEDRVEAIKLVRTDPINLTGVAGEQVFHTHLNIGDPQVRLLESSSEITVRVKLEKILNEGAH
ncbi:MAG: hypothetical protein ABSH31_20210, partial [Bryobacteraceae bacterium]